MRWWDVIGYTFGALSGHRTRSALMLLAMAIGVAAVILLTSLGEGARRFIADQFAGMGTNLMIVLPGKSETRGGAPATFVGETPRDLTLDDALALKRHPSVRAIAPLSIGAAPVSHGGLEREVTIMGSSAELITIMRFDVAQGRFLPEQDIALSSAVTVLGGRVKDELFGNENALGEFVRIGDRRFRVIGILKSERQAMGMEADDIAIVPVSAALSLFNTSSLFRIFVEARYRDAMPRVEEFIVQTIKERHQGEEDITVMTPDAMLKTFDNIIQMITMGVAGIAAISLAVAGILVMNVMLIAVSQRTAEIGLLKALGATPRQVQGLFLTEAIMLSLFGCAFGIAVGYLGMTAINLAFDQFTAVAPWWAPVAATTVAAFTGLVFGVMPARRAARLEPVQALARH